MKQKKSQWFSPSGLLGCLLALICMLCLIPAMRLAAQDAVDDTLLENLSLLSEVLARVHQEHLDTPDTKQLIYGAIRGMLRTLDPYSQFFEPENYDEFRTESRGTYGGLGMEIGIRQERLTIIAPIKGTPADEAGIHSGDMISQIEGESTAGMTADDAVKRLRGEPGTSVTLTIIRDGESEPLEVTITRDVIRFRSVEFKVLKEDIGYIRINQFRETTAEDVDSAFEAFSQQETHGIVLDLRSNPGGLLRSAVEVASDFLAPGQLIVYTQGKQPREDFVVAPGKQQKDYHLIVLVNGGSASGSEIIAAAIKDHGRGLIMGTKTFGKASVQQVFPLSGGAAIKLTIAHYYSPKGADIHNVGITPDIDDPWFSLSENQMLAKLRSHEKIKAFITENGDDVLAQLQKAQLAPNTEREAAALLRKYQRLVDSLLKEQIILSDIGLKFAIARETKNDLDDYEYDPQILGALQQLRAIGILQSKLK